MNSDIQFLLEEPDLGENSLCILFFIMTREVGFKSDSLVVSVYEGDIYI